MTTTQDKMEKNIIDTFAEYVTKNYSNIKTNIEVFQDQKTDVLDEQRPNPLFPNCQGCIEGQPNQAAHINWGGCLSMCDESTSVEEDNDEDKDNDDTSSYCSTTSYESDGGNATIPTSATMVEPTGYNGPLSLPSASTILTRRRTNSN